MNQTVLNVKPNFCYKVWVWVGVWDGVCVWVGVWASRLTFFGQFVFQKISSVKENSMFYLRKSRE